jgi:8-oxo-dGTP diphosphatase
MHDPLHIPMKVSDPTLDVHAFLVRVGSENLSTPHSRSTTKLAHPASLSSILSAVQVATK